MGNPGALVSRAFAEWLAQALYADHIALEDIEHAFLLGCTGKYVSWLNGQISAPLLSDTSDPSSTKLQMDTSLDYWRYVSESLDKYERAWLAHCTNSV